jgi:P63C domain
MSQKILNATHGSDKTPLKIGDIELPCYVLEEGTAVLSSRAVQIAIGFPSTASGLSLGKLISNGRLKDYVSSELKNALENPIKFKRPGAGGTAPLTHGYEATILIDVCYVLIDAKNKGVRLTEKERMLEMQAQAVVRAFSKTGIIAVIYNVTGYQDQVVMGALNDLLNKMLLNEAKKYYVTFPVEFYRQIFRLNNWQWKPENAQKKPSVIGNWTKDLIYKRMAPRLLKELEKRNPKNEKGYREHKHFQFLTDEVGEPRLREFFGGLLALARANTQWRKFYDMVEKAFPKYNEDGSQTQVIPYPTED